MRKIALMLSVALLSVLIIILFLTGNISFTGFFQLFSQKKERLGIESIEDALEILPLDRIFDIYILENSSIDLYGFSNSLGLPKKGVGKLDTNFSILATSPVENISILFLKTPEIERLEGIFEGIEKKDEGIFSLYRNESISAFFGKNFAIFLSGNDSISLIPFIYSSLEEGNNQSIIDFFPLFQFYFLMPSRVGNSSRTLFALSRGDVVNSLAFLYSKSSSENSTFLLIVGLENFLNLTKNQLLSQATILRSFKIENPIEMNCHEASLQEEYSIVCKDDSVLLIISGDKEISMQCLEEFKNIKVLP